MSKYELIEEKCNMETNDIINSFLNVSNAYLNNILGKYLTKAFEKLEFSSFVYFSMQQSFIEVINKMIEIQYDSGKLNFRKNNENLKFILLQLSAHMTFFLNRNNSENMKKFKEINISNRDGIVVEKGCENILNKINNNYFDKYYENNDDLCDCKNEIYDMMPRLRDNIEIQLDICNRIFNSKLGKYKSPYK